MMPLLSLLLGCVLGSAPEGSFLYRPAYCLDDVLRLPAEPYQPQPGDLFLATTASRLMRLGHRLAGAASPHHSGIVFRRPDGQLDILEAGPFNEVVVRAEEALFHLRAYDQQGLVFIRRRRVP